MVQIGKIATGYEPLKIQTVCLQLQCCGVLSPSDYASTQWAAHHSQLTVPLTCCALLNSQVKLVRAT